MRTWILALLLTAPATAQRIEGDPSPVATCLPALQDAATGGCIGASSVPTQGMLYPLGPDFYIDSLGTMRLGGPLTAQGEIVSRDYVSGTEVYAAGINVLGREGLGIGTTAPGADLHIRRPESLEVLLEANPDAGSLFDQPRIRFSSFGGLQQIMVGLQEGSPDLALRNYAHTGGFNFDISTFSRDSWEFRRRASSGTDVEARLRYDGNLSLDGNVSTGGADLAEYYPLVGSVEPGDVVAFSEDGLTLERAHAGSAQRVAGVISSRPGLVLGLSYTRADETGVAPPSLRRALDETPQGSRRAAHHSEALRSRGDELAETPVDPDVLHEIDVNRRAPLALAGRVPVKATAENGPIAAGDLLTLSSVPGRAAKAVDPGVVIGTALESLHAGEGTVVAFVRTGWHAPSREDAVAALERELQELRAEIFARFARLEERLARE